MAYHLLSSLQLVRDYLTRNSKARLPGKSIISEWKKLLNPCPGLNAHTLELLGHMASSYRQNHGVQLLWCLKFDEMHIRQGIRYDKHTGKVFGLVVVGDSGDDDTERAHATKALFFQLCTLNGDKVKQSIGYALVNGLTGVQKRDMITHLVETCDRDYGIEIVVSFTHAFFSLDDRKFNYVFAFY